MRPPHVPGAAVLAVDPGAGGEGREGDLGEDEVDLGDQDQPPGRTQAAAETPLVSGYSIYLQRNKLSKKYLLISKNNFKLFGI